MTKLPERISQVNNSVTNGDIIGGDKIIQIIRDKAPAVKPLGRDLNFTNDLDKNNTTLLKKLTDGKVNPVQKDYAVHAKVTTLALLVRTCRSDAGRKFVGDIYDNLVALIVHKYLAEMESGGLLKTHMSDIWSEFESMVSKYGTVIPIDQAFLAGLLYIATSNCAIRWNVESA